MRIFIRCTLILVLSLIIFQIYIEFSNRRELVATDNWQNGLDAYDRKDYKTAFKKWKPLAENGDALAQSKLGLMYNNGKGVVKDYVQAYKWYTLAGANGIEKALKLRKKIDNRLTLKQISRAKRLARKWVLVDNRFLFFAPDINLDGKFTISDVTIWSKWIFFYPGDFLAYLLITKWKPVSKFLEISKIPREGWGSGIISLVFWYILIIYFFWALRWINKAAFSRSKMAKD